MSPMEENHKRWLEEAKRIGAVYILDVCDTFEWDNYPVYVMKGDDLEKSKLEHNGKNMQQIDAVVEVETGKII